MEPTGSESIKSSPTVSVFKRELMRLIRPPKRSLFGFHDHDIEGVRLLTCYELHLATFANIDLDINFSAPVSCASARLELKITNTFSCTAHATVVIAETSLTVPRMLLM